MYQEFNDEFSIDMILDATQRVVITHFLCFCLAWQIDKQKYFKDKFYFYFTPTDRKLVEASLDKITLLDYSNISIRNYKGDFEFITAYIDVASGQLNDNAIINTFAIYQMSTLFYFFYISLSRKKRNILKSYYLEFYPATAKEKIKNALENIDSFIETYGCLAPSRASVRALYEVNRGYSPRPFRNEEFFLFVLENNAKNKMLLATREVACVDYTPVRMIE